MKTVWIWIKKTMAWVIKHPTAIVSTLAAAAGAYLMWLSAKNKIATIEEAIEVQGAKTKIAKQEIKAKMLAERGEGHVAESAELESQIKDSKRRVVEINEGAKLDHENDDDIATLFNQAGF